MIEKLKWECNFSILTFQNHKNKDLEIFLSQSNRSMMSNQKESCRLHTYVHASFLLKYGTVPPTVHVLHHHQHGVFRTSSYGTVVRSLCNIGTYRYRTVQYWYPGTAGSARTTVPYTHPAYTTQTPWAPSRPKSWIQWGVWWLVWPAHGPNEVDKICFYTSFYVLDRTGPLN